MNAKDEDNFAFVKVHSSCGKQINLGHEEALSVFPLPIYRLLNYVPETQPGRIGRGIKKTQF